MAGFSMPTSDTQFLDPKTKTINRVWFLFLNNLFASVGSGVPILPIIKGGTNSGIPLSGSSVMISNGVAIIQGQKGTTTTVLHGNASGDPTYGSVNLSTDASGTVQAAQFPALTGDVTSAAGSLATTIANVVSAGANTKITYNAKGQVVASAAAVLDTSDFINQGTTTTVLHGNASGNPSWGQVQIADLGFNIYARQNASKSADTSTTSNTLANDADLSLNVVAGTYNVEIFLAFYEPVGTGGFQFDLNGGSAAISEILWGTDGYITAVAGNPAATAASTAQQFGTIATSSSAPSWIRTTGQVLFSGSGTFILRWAQNTASVNATTLKKHSFMTMEKVA